MDIESAVTEVKTVAQQVVDAVDSVAAARQALQLTALKVLVACGGDPAAERQLIGRLYWEVPDLPIKTLEAVVGAPTRVRQLAGTGPVIGPCVECSVDVEAKSRTHLSKPGRLVCEPCTRRLKEEERARIEAALADPSPPVPLEWYDDLGDPYEDDHSNGHRHWVPTSRLF